MSGINESDTKLMAEIKAIVEQVEAVRKGIRLKGERFSPALERLDEAAHSLGLAIVEIAKVE